MATGKILSNSDIGGILIVTTTPSGVLTNKQNECDLAGLFPCNHSEVDSRIMLHLMHAVSQSYTDAYVRTVSSDVVVLAIAFFDQFCLSKLWIGVGTGKHCRDIPVHDIKSALGPTRLLARPLFHSLSGCDTTSQLLGIGKKTVWSTWKSMSELTETSLNLTHDPHTFSMDTADMKQLERFTVLMYSRSCSATSVDEARLQLFTHGSCTLEALTPTKAALYQHVKRAILQACFFWKQSVSSQQVIPDFAEWGWKLDEKVKQWVPSWTDLPDASSACSLPLHCGCQNHVKVTASVPGQAYVAHLYASAMTDVSKLTMNNGLQYVMVYHMWYIRVISYYNVGQAQLINVTEIRLWCGDCIVEFQITIKFLSRPHIANQVWPT